MKRQAWMFAGQTQGLQVTVALSDSPTCPHLIVHCFLLEPRRGPHRAPEARKSGGSVPKVPGGKSKVFARKSKTVF